MESAMAKNFNRVWAMRPHLIDSTTAADPNELLSKAWMTSLGSPVADAAWPNPRLARSGHSSRT